MEINSASSEVVTQRTLITQKIIQIALLGKTQKDKENGDLDGNDDKRYSIMMGISVKM